MELSSLRKANQLFAANSAASANPIGEAGPGNPIANLAQSFAAFLARGGNRMSSTFTSPTAINPTAVAEKNAERPDASADASSRDGNGPARERVTSKERPHGTDKPKVRAEAKDKPAPIRERDADDAASTQAADDADTATASAATSDDGRDSADTQASDTAATTDDAAAAPAADQAPAATAAATDGVQTQAAAATVAANSLSQVLITEIEVDVVETETTIITISGPGAAQAAAELGDELGVTFTPTKDQGADQGAAAPQTPAEVAQASQADQAQDLAADAAALLRAAANPVLTQQAAGIAKATGGNQHLSVQVTTSETSTTSTSSLPTVGLASLLALSDSVGADTADAVMAGAGPQNANNSTANANQPQAVALNAAMQAAVTDVAQAADDLAAASGEIKGASAATSAQNAQTGASTSSSGAQAGANATVSTAPTTSTNSTATTSPTTAMPKPATHHQPLSEQITVHIDQALQQGLDKIKIQLRPEDMGRIEVRLEVGQGGQLNTTIIADRPEALDALRRDSGELERSLRAAGLDPQAGGMNFSLRGEQHRDQQANNNGRSGQGAFGDEGVPGQGDERTSEVSNAVWTRRETRAAARGGLDIRV